jgi:hypothetical protein
MPSAKRQAPRPSKLTDAESWVLNRGSLFSSAKSDTASKQFIKETDVPVVKGSSAIVPSAVGSWGRLS